MIMPLSIRKTFLGCILALASGGAGFSQTYTTNGGEYAILPAVPGDQIHPQLAVNSKGGYLTWDDNAVDGRGQGIGAQALDNNFAPVGPRFRVNQIGAADQELPRAALLNNGGAVWVWQSGRRGFQHVYARFLGAGAGSNYWMGGDVLVDTFTNHYQINPAVAMLTNGNVVVVWASQNEFSSSSMQDVYGQLFSPSGQKIGGEFLVNQFTTYNQRTPAIAALAGGGFVTSWVSEQERFDGSVDVYARLFNADGSAAGSEILVDTDTNICANPSVAAASDGTFAVAWGEQDLTVQNQTFNGGIVTFNTNSWDVYVRTFSAAGTGGAMRLVNTYRFGDQYAPKLSALGTNYLEVWTSMGQDGSWEGVYGQFLGGDGSAVGGEFRVNTTTVGSQIYPSVLSDQSQRLLVTWSSFSGLPNGLDLFAQLYAPPGYVPQPSVASYYPVLYDPYPDPSLVAAPPLPFAIAANDVVSNEFASAQGTYHGLFYNTNGVTPATAGYITLHTTKKGAYSGAITLANHAYKISGQFNPLTGWATNTVGKGEGAMTVEIQLDVVGGKFIAGQIIAAGWSAELGGDLQEARQAGTPGSYSGYYVLTIPAASSGGPQGTSYGTVKVDNSGNVKFNGSFSDGTKASQSSGVSADGWWPLFATLYGGRGTIMAWMQFDTNGSLSGDLVWVKPTGAATKSFGGGFTNDVEATGTLYVKPSRGQRLFEWTNDAGNVVLSGGGLLEPLTNSFLLNENNQLSMPRAEGLKLNINSSLGTFSGKASVDGNKRLPFGGVLWPGGIGLGFFSTTNQSGATLLAPAPMP